EEVAEQQHYVSSTFPLPPRNEEDNEQSKWIESSPNNRIKNKPRKRPRKEDTSSKNEKKAKREYTTVKKPIEELSNAKELQHDSHVPTPVSQIDMTKA
ncbi:8393_t:CDS:2, partial [Ambispora gerdemannii]